jgi:hypothetical protein
MKVPGEVRLSPPPQGLVCKLLKLKRLRVWRCVPNRRKPKCARNEEMEGMEMRLQGGS